MKKTTILKKLLSIDLEIKARCGDGGIPSIITHSINCRCEELNKKKNKYLDYLNSHKE